LVRISHHECATVKNGEGAGGTSRSRFVTAFVLAEAATPQTAGGGDIRVRRRARSRTATGPPEHDLFMFAGTAFFPADRFGWFLDRYEDAFRPISLDADVFGFYFYRRNIEDLAEFVASLTAGGGDDADLRAALGYTADLVDEWPQLERRTTAVRRLLHDRS